MKIAHLILVHKDPFQVERLLNAIDHNSFNFYIHVDKKSDLEPFLYLLKRSNVYFIKKRVKVYWAGYGTIQATINGFKEILLNNYDYINVISGQDFPIKTSEYIYNYILERKGCEFITCQSIYDNGWSEASIRVKNYSLINLRIPGKFRIEKFINKILPERKFPLEYKIVGRANWFTISSDAAAYSLQFLNDHPEITRFFKYCWGADELIFSTILYNSRFNSKIKDNLVFVSWDGAHKGHPKILTIENYDELVSSEKLFARKFDVNIDDNILKMIEKNILNDR